MFDILLAEIRLSYLDWVFSKHLEMLVSSYGNESNEAFKLNVYTWS